MNHMPYTFWMLGHLGRLSRTVAVQINEWLLRARDANTGEVLHLPATSEGGSNTIMEQAAAAAQLVEPPAAAKSAARAPGKAAQAPAKKGTDAGEPM